MASRIVRSLPKTGSVSRRKIRAAVRAIGKNTAVKGKRAKKITIRKSDTASGRKLIAFRKPSHKAFAA